MNVKWHLKDVYQMFQIKQTLKGRCICAIWDNKPFLTDFNGTVFEEVMCNLLNAIFKQYLLEFIHLFSLFLKPSFTKITCLLAETHSIDSIETITR